jgi:hypothetical protein
MADEDEKRLPGDAVSVVEAKAMDGPPVESNARIALHFHPDSDVLGRPTLLQILADGVYFSQFVTGSSNGGLTASGHGDRWQWEHRLFDGWYDKEPASARPVYGALTIAEDPYGPAPRFGSAYLLLRRPVVDRSTFAYPDSTFNPTTYGTARRMALAALLNDHPRGDPLDRYVEAHVHGGVSISEDVEALILDPCFEGTELVSAALAAGLEVRWHPGYRLAAHELGDLDDYRGTEVVTLARRIALTGTLTPTTIGILRGLPDVDSQLLKRVWHLLARFGRVGGVPDVLS